MTCYNCRACMSGRMTYACSVFSKAKQYISYNSTLVESIKRMSLQQNEVKKTTLLIRHIGLGCFYEYLGHFL